MVEGVGVGESVSAGARLSKVLEGLKVADICMDDCFVDQRREPEITDRLGRGRTRAVAQPPARAPD